MMIFDELKKNDPHLRILTIGVLVGMGILLAGLWYVQILSSRHFVADQKAQSFRTVRIPAIRGKILDRNGHPLAENRPSYNICLYLDELRSEFTRCYTNQMLPEYRRAHPGEKRIPRKISNELKREARYRAASNIVQRLARTLQEPIVLDPADFHRHYQSSLALPMPVMLNLSSRQLARFQEHPSLTVGVDLEVQPNRAYPHEGLLAHTLGYLGRDNRSTIGEDAFVNYRLPDYSGIIGLEWAFDQSLRGKGGVKSVLVNSLGYRQAENVWTPAEPGKNVVVTIDLAIQQAAEAALLAARPYTNGAVVVMDPNSGDILALVSSPGFDPNSFIPGISSNQFQSLLDKTRKPLRNRAIQENYHPGSIFKIVSGLAALETGLDPHAEIYNPGRIIVGRAFNDLAPPGNYDFRKAFALSSNTYFITNGMKAGIETIVRLGQKLHLGERTGIPTGQEVSGNFPEPKDIRRGWYAGDTANVCIGQGLIDMTPIQAAVLVSSIANGGKVLWPRLVMRIEPQDPNSEEEVVRFEGGRIRDHLGVSQRSIDVLRDAMLADVEMNGGSGVKAAVLGMRVCGKTGTAQVTDARGKIIDHTTWFASYAPFEQPRYVVVVMVEGGVSGGSTCAPIAQAVYKALQNRENSSGAAPPRAIAQAE